MEEIISDDEIIEAAVKMDDYLLDQIDQGFSVSAINGIVLARLLMLNRETKNENDFFEFISSFNQESQLTTRTLQ
jgi:hypothetical protein